MADPVIAIEEEMKRSYLDYAMSVIVGRALPDVRDGLKPVHRRILYAMHESGYDWNKPFRKSARVIGDVIGKYHPHGEQAVYDALVRMAQLFSMRLPLIEGQGNFGSIDGDPPAAMRYTEVRLARQSSHLLADIDKEVVTFQPNYDNGDVEPTILPAGFPNLLVNGASGIAVGMATNIAPHNLGEVIAACLALIENPDISIEELLQIIPGPDFPTGGLILGHSGSRAAAHLGRGSVIMRACVMLEPVGKDRQAIIVTEIPYQVNKTTLIEKIASLVREKRITQIADLRDESDRDGIRIVLTLKRETVAEIVLNQLYRFTPLQTNFAVNMLALRNGRPELLNLLEVLQAFLAFREEVIVSRTYYTLKKHRSRAHLTVGLAIAAVHVAPIVELIKKAPNPAQARKMLMAQSWPAENIAPYLALIADPDSRLDGEGGIRLSPKQAQAILDLRLQRLTALGREEIADELKILGEKIADCLAILGDRKRILSIIRTELTEIGDNFATPRKSVFVDVEHEVEDEDLIPQEDMIVTLTHGGYVKRVALESYRTQNRGGRGRNAMATVDQDFVTRVFVAHTHMPVLFFSSTGMVYSMKVWKLPLHKPQSRGRPLINLLPLAKGETIATMMNVETPQSEWDSLQILFATSHGLVRRNALQDFANIRSNGKIAMKLDENVALVNVAICSEQDHCLLTTSKGQAICFPVRELRVMKGRNSQGVRGIRLQKGDRVIASAILQRMSADTAQLQAYLRQSAEERRSLRQEKTPNNISIAPDKLGEDDAQTNNAPPLSMAQYTALREAEQFLLAITEQGYGKRTSHYAYRVTHRGSKGIIAMNLGKRQDRLAACFPVEEGDHIFAATSTGQMIRTNAEQISVQGRNATGVRVLRIGQEEHVVSVARLAEENRVPEDTPPEDTRPEDTPPEDTPPEDTPPEDTPIDEKTMKDK